jgi:hypothetical protein
MSSPPSLPSMLLALLILFLGANVTSAQVLDEFSIRKVYESDPEKSSYDWQSKWWASERTLKNHGDVDPKDRRTRMQGSSDGGITLRSGESVHHPGRPRLYITKDEDGDSSSTAPGFENIEITVYANWQSDGERDELAGFTIMGRSNHLNIKNDGCSAAGYYAKFWADGESDGKTSFAKEYFHDHDSDKTVYADGVYRNTFSKFPKNQWIGVKFVIATVSETQKVQLELYLDLTDGRDGGDWILEHTYIDRPGRWDAQHSVPSRCPIQSGDTILGERSSCALRSDGGEVHWKKASVRHILPSLTPATSPPTPNPMAPPSQMPTARVIVRPTALPTRMPTPEPTPTPSASPTSRPAVLQTPTQLPPPSTSAETRTTTTAPSPMPNTFPPFIPPSMSSMDSTTSSKREKASVDVVLLVSVVLFGVTALFVLVLVIAFRLQIVPSKLSKKGLFEPPRTQTTEEVPQSIDLFTKLNVISV